MIENEMITERFYRRPWIGVLLLFVYVSLTACATKPTVVNSSRQHTFAAKTSGKGWWYARFRMNWPEDDEPAWHIDALLAHHVVAPVLDEYQQEIELWRFHRRAARQGGHLFSFIFYSHPDIALSIYKQIESNNTVIDLMADGTVEKLFFDDVNKLARPNIEDTSDREWNEIIQKTWPHFIMGVSKMWLDMINRLVVYNRDKSDPEKELFLHIHNGITGLWEHEGGHAFFHHLNALFAYKPIQIIERRSMKY